MDPITIAMLAAGGSQVLSGVLGYLVEQGRIDEANGILQQARDQYGNISLPKLQQAAAEVLGPSHLSQIQQDPALRSAQLNALSKFKQMEDGGGFTAEDRANLNRIQNQAAQAESAQRAALTEQMNARGIGGSGAELAMQLANSQAAANRSNQAGLDVAGQAQQRYFDAIRGRSTLAGQMRAQDWSQQAQAASAQDAIDRFNLGNRFQVAQYNNSLAQQQYANQLGQADRRYGMARDQAAAIRGDGQRAGQAIAGAGQQAGNAIFSYGMYQQGQGQGQPRTQPAQQAGTQYSSDPYANFDPYSNW